MVEVWKKIRCSGQSKATGTFELHETRIQWKNERTLNTYKWPCETVLQAVWLRNSKHVKACCDLELEIDGGSHVTFAAFAPHAKTKISAYISEKCKVEMTTDEVECSGPSWGDINFEGNALVIRAENEKRVITLPYEDIVQCAVPTKREIEIQMEEPEENNARGHKASDEVLVEMRLYIPKPHQDATAEEQLEKMNEIKETIKEKANIKDDDAGVIVELSAQLGNFLTPRGKYAMELFGSHMRLHGKTYDYRISYKNVERLLLLPSTQDGKWFFIISLKRPIRQGQQQYEHLVMSLNNKQYVLNVQLNEEEIEEKYGENSLAPEMTDEMYKLVFRCFKHVIGQKIYSTGKYRTAKHQSHSLNVAVGSNNGHLYMLKKSFMYIHKPALHIPYSSVTHVEFHRFSYQTNVSSRSFDMEVAYGEKTRTFKNIERGEFENLLRYVESKALSVRNKPVRAQSGAIAKQVTEFMGESDEDDSDYSNQSESDESYAGSSDDSEEEAAAAAPSKRKSSGSKSKPKKRSKR